MNMHELGRLLNDSKLLERRIQQHLHKRSLFGQSVSKAEIQGHIIKARHNLDFIRHIPETFNDWVLVGCYYAAYHAALALLLKTGHTSKNHDATLCILIKHHYKKDLTKSDIELLNCFDAEDILFYVQSRQERQRASYTTTLRFDKKTVTGIILKTQLFVNKSACIAGI